MHGEYKKPDIRKEYENAILNVFESASGKLIFSALAKELINKNTFQSILNGLEGNNPNYTIDGIMASQKMAYEEGKLCFIRDVMQILKKYDKLLNLQYDR